MKLVDLIPLKEIDFTNQKAFDAYNQKHQLRPDTKVTIAGKVTTAGKAAQKSAPVKGTSVFGNKPTNTNKSKYDDKSYWKVDKRQTNLDGDWGEDSQFTADSLSKVEDAITDEFGNEFETTRESGGGGGGYEGPMQIFSKDADVENAVSISVGSNNQDGTFGIVFLGPGGEDALFEPNWDAMTGDKTLTPQQTYKVTKALLKMPEVQKLLKGEIGPDEFEGTYAKLKSKFSKNESMKLKSMIKNK